MESKTYPIFTKFKKNVRNKLLTGLLVILPVYITFFIVRFVFQFVGGRLAPYIKGLFKHDFGIPEAVLNPLVIVIGLIITFVVLYFIGAFATNFFGRQIISFYERIINNTPVIKNIYSSSKQVIHTFSASQGSSFKRVVIVEFPRPGLQMFGFITNTVSNKDGHALTSVFIPTTPNPTTGFLVYLPEKDIKNTNMSVEEAFKLIISGGILLPDSLDFTTTEGVVWERSGETEFRGS